MRPESTCPYLQTASQQRKPSCFSSPCAEKKTHIHSALSVSVSIATLKAYEQRQSSLSLRVLLKMIAIENHCCK